MKATNIEWYYGNEYEDTEKFDLPYEMDIPLEVIQKVKPA